MTMTTRIQALDDAQLDEAIRILQPVNADQRLVRAALLAEYERRHGPEEVDRLIDEVGLVSHSPYPYL